MRMSLALLFAILGFHGSLLLAQDDGEIGDVTDFSLEEILVENWNAVSDSIRTSHLRIKVYRKLLTQPEDRANFELEKYLALVDRCQSKDEFNDLLPEFEKIMFPTHPVKGNTPYWGYHVDVWHREKSTVIDYRKASVG